MDLDLGVYPDCCMAVGLYELETCREMMRWLRPGDHFVDGGANIGYYTMLAARRVGPTGRVDAFEPMPANRERLEQHLSLNGLADLVRVHSEALAEVEGEVNLVVPDGENGNHGCVTMFPRSGMTETSWSVPTVRIDERLKGTMPRLIKLDLEGAEPRALRGASGLLQSESPPTIVVEFSGTHLKLAGETAASLVDTVFSAKSGYKARILDFPRREVTPDANELQGMGQVNLWFWHNGTIG